MNMSEQFQRFAAECEVMAKFTSNPENQLVWRRMAERGQPNRGMFSADRRVRSACRRGKPVLWNRHGHYDLSVGTAIACAMSTPTFIPHDRVYKELEYPRCPARKQFRDFGMDIVFALTSRKITVRGHWANAASANRFSLLRGNGRLN